MEGSGLVTLTRGGQCEGSGLVTLSRGGQWSSYPRSCEGSAFVFCLFVSVHAHNSKTITPIDLIFYTLRSIPLARYSSKMIEIAVWTRKKYSPS